MKPIKKLSEQKCKLNTVADFKYKIIKRKVNNTKLHNINADKEILYSEDDVISPKVNLFRIDSAISYENNLYNVMKLNENDKEILFRQFQSKYTLSKKLKENDNFRDCKNSKAHNLKSVSKTFSSAPKSKFRDVLIDLNAVDLSVQNNTCYNKNYKNKYNESWQNLINSSVNINVENSNITATDKDEIEKEKLRLAGIVSEDIAEKKLIVKLTQLNKNSFINVSPFHEDFLKNNYIERSSSIEKKLVCFLLNISYLVLLFNLYIF